MHRGHLSSRQRGAAVVMMAGFMLLAALCLTLVVDTGRLYLEQRKLQRIADLAALESAGRQGCTPGRSAQAMAVQAAARNGFTIAASRQLVATCGHIEVISGERSFVADAGSSQAIRVVAGNSVAASLVAGGLIGGRVSLSARAVALRMEPTAVFRVGSKLINTNGAAPLMSLLKLVGLNLDGTTLASYDGLAGVKITPSGLLNALGIPVSADIGVGELNALLAGRKVALGDILDAAVTLAGQDQLLGANLTVLTAIKAKLGIDSLLVQLGTDPAISGQRGLFALIEAAGGDGAPALNVGVNALDLITAAVGIGTGQNGVAIDVTAGALNILTGLKVGARVVEPQSIGVGGVGTKAYNAQVRLHVDLDTSQGVTGILALLGTVIKLPIIIDAVDAQGTITRIDCDASPRTVTIEVNSSVANACIGRAPASVLWSKSDVCLDGLQDETMVRLLGMTLLRGQVALPALAQRETVTLAVGETRTTGINNLAIGTLLVSLTDELLDLLGRSKAVSEPLNAEQATAIADAYIAKAGLTASTYSGSNLDKIRDLLKADGINWDRPAILLFTQPVYTEWRNGLGSCLSGFSYTAACVRTKLIESLQTGAVGGWLDQLLGGLVGDVVQPLLATILKPLVALLEGLLNDVGKLLSQLLANVLGLELGRTDVTLDSLSCGSAKLVI